MNRDEDPPSDSSSFFEEHTLDFNLPSPKRAHGYFNDNDTSETCREGAPTNDKEMPLFYPKFMSGIGRSMMIDTCKLEHYNTANDHRTVELGPRDEDLPAFVFRQDSNEPTNTLDKMHIMSPNCTDPFSRAQTVPEEKKNTLDCLPPVGDSLVFKGITSINHQFSPRKYSEGKKRLEL